MSYMKVRGHDNLVRDLDSKAILNTDKVALDRYLSERAYAEKQFKEKEELKDKVNNLEKDIGEIKNMLYELTRMRTTNGN